MTIFEEVAAELDAMDDASGRKASDATGNGPAVQYWLGRQCAYREAAAMLRARALASAATLEIQRAKGGG